MYDRWASRYDRMHRRWLRHAGGEAQAALEACLLTRITPGMRVLDAGCGTGALARLLRQRFSGHVHLTLLDASRKMLDGAADIAAERHHGSLLALPFDDGQSDIAVAAWSIEATRDPERAVAELTRVVRPGGHALVAFCANHPVGLGVASLLRIGVQLRQTGRFLDAAAIQSAFWCAGADSVVRHRCAGPAAVIDAHIPLYVQVAA